ncbi:DUF6833 domain-containing protein [Larsenimonas suaedae]|uniref:DUF6833 domain-containing protein n=1 Tax=Larsenimonas suaedae TaxID=1851019 RepID=UPI0035B539B1
MQTHTQHHRRQAQPSFPFEILDTPTSTQPQSLYPTKDSLSEALAYLEGQLPITHSNELYPLLMIYHNTLLKTLGISETRQ